MGGADTWATVFNWLVGDGEFTQVVSNHFGLDFNLVEGFSVVNADHGASHLWHNDHVSKMGLDNV
jgi:hypothetical protein